METSVINLVALKQTQLIGRKIRVMTFRITRGVEGTDAQPTHTIVHNTKGSIKFRFP